MNDPNGKDRPENWERDALLKVALAGIEEQRRGRRWGVFFKLLGFAYLFLILLLVMSDGPGKPGARTGPHTALVDVQGPIAAGANASAETVVRGLRAAFEDKNTKAVLLRINSPGGSPVQAGQINDEIRRLREKHPDIPLYAAVQDICASGAYYIAVAADAIYVDKASLIGSIGVRMDSFGLVDAIDKLGIERRLLTAGEHKGMLDPFLPVDAAEQKHVQGLLDAIHRQFVDTVKAGRGERLKGGDELFSGLIWNGEDAVGLGLVDGLASPGQVARDIVGEERVVDFTPRPDFLRRLAENLGTAFAGALTSAVERPQWR